MESLIFDYYGYKIDKLENNAFTYEGYKFISFASEDDEQTLSKLNDLSMLIYSFFNDGMFIVKNKYNKFISTTCNETNISLLTYKIDHKISINKFAFMHDMFLNYFKYTVNLKEIISLWDQRLEYIQNQCLVNLSFENEVHLKLYLYCNYGFGLAMNALQYLSDINIDFSSKKYNSTLTHRRIKDMNKDTFFNPFNLIVDHSSRDLAQLYINDLIDFETLMSFCKYYNYSIDEYEYLLARLLYPTFIFDVIEDMANENSLYNYNEQINLAINKQNKQFEKIKEYYNNVNQMFNIRPIQWINDIKIL